MYKIIAKKISIDVDGEIKDVIVYNVYNRLYDRVEAIFETEEEAWRYVNSLP